MTNEISAIDSPQGKMGIVETVTEFQGNTCPIVMKFHRMGNQRFYWNVYDHPEWLPVKYTGDSNGFKYECEYPERQKRPSCANCIVNADNGGYEFKSENQ